MNKNIKIQGARENNLKNINIEIPRDKLVVFTGLSGSGKSSLAFDTIYAEGQRRYVESLSSYARQFLGQSAKPDVDFIEGLSPAIAIDQKTTNRNPRSTVGTVTEIYDYLRVLFARTGIPHCPKCGKEIRRQSVDQITDKIMSLGNGTRLQILAPIVKQRKGEHVKLLESAAKSGFAKVIIDDIIYDLNEKIKLDKNKKHNIDIVVDRIVLKDGIQKRLTDSVETACSISGGVVKASVPGGNCWFFSQSLSCPDCDISVSELEPTSFSFNNPSGACPECTGLGVKMVFDEDLVVDKEKSLDENAVTAMGFSSNSSMASALYKALSEKYGFSASVPFKELDKGAKNIILYGTGKESVKIKYLSGGIEKYYVYKFEGIIPSLERRYKETSSEFARDEYEKYMVSIECPACRGKRLKPEVLGVTFAGKNISEICEMPIRAIYDFFENADISEKQKKIGELIINEIKSRLGFLIDVGLDYLCLSRKAATLSGGEAQRIRLATQIGSGLTGVLYVLDEPSIGLHQRDNDKLLATLKNLRDLGNTLIVVEHDTDTVLSADYVVDIGPGAGNNGGNVIFSGTPKELLECRESITSEYITGRKKIPIPEKRRPADPSKILLIRGAAENNLKNIDVSIPLGLFVCVTGVSGSGKSSLINEILYKTLARDLNRAKTKPGKCDGIEGIENLDKIINIDQSPIGRTPRSNPATYIGLFDLIRDLYAEMPEAKAKGYKKGRFSFNTKGGRCENCCGDGIIKIEMHFLPDVYVPCEVCGGKRYNRETLEVKYKGKSISDILDMTVEDALSFFENMPKIKSKIQTLYDVGLSYIKLGQSSTTLSGGESQRVKLASELSRKSTGKTIYILDEPTTGLHTADVHKLVNILQKLVNAGNSVIVIEHNLDVVKTADYVIDLGKEGGDNGGTITAQGTPEDIAKTKSYTGEYLKKYL